MRIDHLRENALIFYQILSTHSLRKYGEISLENLNVDIGIPIVTNIKSLLTISSNCQEIQL